MKQKTVDKIMAEVYHKRSTIKGFGIEKEYVYLPTLEEILNSLEDEEHCAEHIHAGMTCDCSVCRKIYAEIAKRLWLEYEDTHVGRVGVGALSFLNWLDSKE